MAVNLIAKLFQFISQCCIGQVLWQLGKKQSDQKPTVTQKTPLSAGEEIKSVVDAEFDNEAITMLSVWQMLVRVANEDFGIL